MVSSSDGGGGGGGGWWRWQWQGTYVFFIIQVSSAPLSDSPRAIVSRIPRLILSRLDREGLREPPISITSPKNPLSDPSSVSASASAEEGETAAEGSPSADATSATSCCCRLSPSSSIESSMVAASSVGITSFPMTESNSDPGHISSRCTIDPVASIVRASATRSSASPRPSESFCTIRCESCVHLSKATISWRRASSFRNASTKSSLSLMTLRSVEGLAVV